MKNMLLKNFSLLVYIFSIFGFIAPGIAAPEMAEPSVIIMKSSSTFIVNEREVASAELVKSLKKNKISMDAPLVIEIPASTPMDVIKDLTQRLATAGFKPVCK